MGKLIGKTYAAPAPAAVAPAAAVQPLSLIHILRKIANTLRNSVYAQIQWAIGALGLQDMFRCTVSPLSLIHI